jgi:Leucine-rich repeat (LRR) protein
MNKNDLNLQRAWIGICNSYSDGKQFNTNLSAFNEEELPERNSTVERIKAWFKKNNIIDCFLELDLSGLSLDVIPKEIFKFKNLKKLNLRDNEITYVQNEISYLKKLEVLNLKNNMLKNLPNISNLKNLKYINFKLNANLTNKNKNRALGLFPSNDKFKLTGLKIIY